MPKEVRDGTEWVTADEEFAVKRYDENGAVPICCRCDQPSTFIAPRIYCDEHLARWWGGFEPEYPLDNGEGPSQEMYEEAMASIKRHKGTEDALDG